MTTSKTAISLDSSLLEKTDKRAKQTGNSRSGIIAIALQKYFNDLKEQEILEALDRVYDDSLVAAENDFISAGKEYWAKKILKEEQW
jgi:metal-responsive CopG/Arc/MetJ family transcriptional regulator